MSAASGTGHGKNEHIFLPTFPLLPSQTLISCHTYSLLGLCYLVLKVGQCAL